MYPWNISAPLYRYGQTKNIGSYPISGQCSKLVASENFWFCFFRGYKIGKLATEGLISSGILTAARSQCFDFISLKTSKNLGFSDVFRGCKMGTLARNGFKERLKSI